MKWLDLPVLDTAPQSEAELPSIAETLDRARQEAEAARAIILDVADGLAAASVHVARGWQRIAQARAMENGVDPSRPLGEALAELDPRDLKFLSPKDHESFEQTLEQLAGADLDGAAAEPSSALGSVREVLRHADWIERAASTTRRRAGLKLVGVRRWVRWAAAGVGIAAAVILFVLAAPTKVQKKKSKGRRKASASRQVGAWRAVYFGCRDLSGPNKVRREPVIRHDWGKKGPKGIPKDRFSARWDTCLHLEEPGEVTFDLRADAGARLLIDGKKIIDRWKKTKASKANELVTLTAGVHHLRVEYYENRGDAQVSLSIDAKGAKHELIYPGRKLSRSGPCAKIKKADSSQ